MSYHPLYVTYKGMLSRCYRQTDISYPDYGGRGIKVCDKWRESFWNFVADIPPKPSSSHQLDRRDNDGDYEPENVRWLSSAKQNQNKRNSRFLTVDERTQTLGEWALEKGIGSTTLKMRLDTYGWAVKDAVNTPVGRRTRWNKDFHAIK